MQALCQLAQNRATGIQCRLPCFANRSVGTINPKSPNGPVKTVFLDSVSLGRRLAWTRRR